MNEDNKEKIKEKEIITMILTSILHTAFVLIAIFSILYTTIEMTNRASICTVTNNNHEEYVIGQQFRVPQRMLGEIEGIEYKESRLMPFYEITNEGYTIQCEVNFHG